MIKRFEDFTTNEGGPGPHGPNDAQEFTEAIDNLFMDIIDDQTEKTTRTELLIVYINTRMSEEERKEIKDNI